MKKKNIIAKITDQMLARARAMRRHRPETTAPVNPFRLPLHPPNVHASKKMAMDEFGGSLEWAGRDIGAAFAEGQAFLGYPELTLLAQRAEYRVISETIAAEMVRKGYKLKSKSEDGSKSKKIGQLKDFMDSIGTLPALQKAVEQDGYFGRGHIYVDTGDTDNPEELKVPLSAAKSKINKDHPIKALRTVEAVWAYPTNYNSDDPLKENWYRPNHWFVQAKEIHRTRLLTFIGREVGDLLKPAYSFGGLSLSQIAKPYIDNWLRTRQSVADIIHAFSVMVLATDLSTTLQNGGDQVFKRAELFNNFRDNLGLMMINKDTEEFQNVSVPLGGLDTLQAQSQEHMAAVSKIPLVKLLGIQPQGLNADSEGVMRAFYDTISAYQKKFFDPQFPYLLSLGMLSLWGEVDEDIVHEWEPLKEMDEKEAADIRKTDAETGDLLIANGTLHPIEERQRVASDEDTRYPGLDVDNVPEDPRQMETEGAEGGEEGEEEEESPDDARIPAEAMDAAPFEESKHKRDKGKFSSTGGSGGGKPKPHESREVQKQQFFEAAAAHTDHVADFYEAKGENQNKDLAKGMRDAAKAMRTGKLSPKHLQYISYGNLKKYKKLLPAGDPLHAKINDILSGAASGETEEETEPGEETGSFKARGKAKKFLNQEADRTEHVAKFYAAEGETQNMALAQSMMAAAGIMRSGEISEEDLGYISYGSLRKLSKMMPEDHPMRAKIKEIVKRAPQASDEVGFQESKHPRDKDGKFSTSGGGGGAHNEAVASVLSQSHQTGSDALKKTMALIAASQGEQKKELVTHFTHQLLKKHIQLVSKGSNNAGKYLEKFKGMPDEAKQAALKKYGTPSALQSSSPSKPSPNKPPTSVASSPELEKAKSKTAISWSMFHKLPPQKVDAFNKKYTGENTPTTEAGLKEKVAAFKVLKEENDAAAKQEAAKQQAEAEKLMTPEAKEHAQILKDVGQGKYHIDSAQAKIKSAGLEGVITAPEAAHILAYSGNAYTETNQALRAGVMSEERWKHVKALNKALDKLPPHVGVTKRGAHLTKDQIALYQVGMVVEERGFMSTSTSKPWGGVQFEVHGKTGRNISKLSHHPGEREVLFPSGTRFKVASNNGSTIVLHEVE